ncbi:unnamed protein product, partial [Discosporangium mesarthrocarpum]
LLGGNEGVQGGAEGGVTSAGGSASPLKKISRHSSVPQITSDILRLVTNRPPQSAGSGVGAALASGPEGPLTLAGEGQTSGRTSKIAEGTTGGGKEAG